MENKGGVRFDEGLQTPEQGDVDKTRGNRSSELIILNFAKENITKCISTTTQIRAGKGRKGRRTIQRDSANSFQRSRAVFP